MIWAKLIPWAGYPLALALFFFWLDGRENLAAEVERCNTEKVAHAADAANAARDAITRAYDERMADLRRRRAQAEGAVSEAVAGRQAALQQAEAAQRIIDELTRTIEADNNAPISTLCLAADVPDSILERLR